MKSYFLLFASIMYFLLPGNANSFELTTHAGIKQAAYNKSILSDPLYCASLGITDE